MKQPWTRFFSAVFGRFRLGKLRGRTKILARTIVGLIAIVAIRASDRAVRSARPRLINAFRPQPAHPFGTDQFGRDVLSRTIYATAAST
jgi:ABC-type dipeptide/oligopeptide/nickel transport system permease subunit